MEDMYVERLAERLGISAPTVSFHLKKLTEAGAEVEGSSVTVFYEGSTPLLGGLEAWEEETAKRLNPVNYIRNSRRLKNLIE